MIVVNTPTYEKIKEQGFTESGFLKTVQAGTVDFGKSKKQGLDKVYRIDYETSKGKKKHCFMTMGDESFMTEIIFSPKKAAKISPSVSDSSSAASKILFFPKNKFLFYMDSSQVFQQKMKEAGIPNDKKLNELIRKYGQFSFRFSRMTVHPKPIHSLLFRVRNDAKEDLLVQCIWYKDKIKVYYLKRLPLNF
jgi:hypothetical protein